MKFAAIFDWDGVIIDSSAQHERSWELLAAEIGKPLPEGHFKRGFGKKNEAIIPDLGWAADPPSVQALGLRKEELYRELIRGRRDAAARRAGIAGSAGSGRNSLCGRLLDAPKKHRDDL